jgi:transposase-like protein
MPLAQNLYHATFTHPCPHCAHEFRKKGSFFATAHAGYTCPSCYARVAMTYPMKIALFDANARADT